MELRQSVISKLGRIFIWLAIDIIFIGIEFNVQFCIQMLCRLQYVIGEASLIEIWTRGRFDWVMEICRDH